MLRFTATSTCLALFFPLLTFNAGTANALRLKIAHVPKAQEHRLVEQCNNVYARRGVWFDEVSLCDSHNEAGKQISWNVNNMLLTEHREMRESRSNIPFGESGPLLPIYSTKEHLGWAWQRREGNRRGAPMNEDEGEIGLYEPGTKTLSLGERLRRAVDVKAIDENLLAARWQWELELQEELRLENAMDEHFDNRIWWRVQEMRQERAREEERKFKVSLEWQQLGHFCALHGMMTCAWS